MRFVTPWPALPGEEQPVTLGVGTHRGMHLGNGTGNAWWAGEAGEPLPGEPIPPNAGGTPQQQQAVEETGPWSPQQAQLLLLRGVGGRKRGV